MKSSTSRVLAFRERKLGLPGAPLKKRPGPLRSKDVTSKSVAQHHRRDRASSREALGKFVCPCFYVCESSPRLCWNVAATFAGNCDLRLLCKRTVLPCAACACLCYSTDLCEILVCPKPCCWHTSEVEGKAWAICRLRGAASAGPVGGTLYAEADLLSGWDPQR